MSNERPTHSATVKDKTDKESKTKRWYGHFNEVLNRENPSNPVSIVKIEAANGNEEIDTSEIKEATKHLKNRKAPCIYNIRAELLKADFFCHYKSKRDQ